MNSYTEEQERIVSLLLNERKNVLVEAVAGSGKTTTLFHLAEKAWRDEIWIVLYNRRLARETQKRIPQARVSTIHSLFQRVYGIECYSDIGLYQIFFSQEIFPQEEINFDILAIDEAQDLTPILVGMIQRLLSDHEEPERVRILLLGDRRQCIYKYQEASENFMLQASSVFPLLQGEWAFCTLSQTFRCTIGTTNFVNYLMTPSSSSGALVGPYLYSNRPGPKPVYWQTNLDSCSSIFAEILTKLYKKYSPSDIAIIAPHVQNNVPLRKLINNLIKADFQAYVTVDEERDVFVTNKDQILVSTIHQMKGRERKVIFLFGFDSGFLKFFHESSKESQNASLPNLLYVGLTRARELLYLVASHRHSPLECLKDIDPYVEYPYPSTPLYLRDDHYEPPDNEVAVKEIIKSLSSLEIYQFFTYFSSGDRFESLLRYESLEFDPTFRDDERVEDLSSIYGIVVPMVFCHRLNQKQDPLSIVSEARSETRPEVENQDPLLREHPSLQEVLEMENPQIRERYASFRKTFRSREQGAAGLTWPEWLLAANLYQILKGGYIHLTSQFTIYDQVDTEILEELVSRCLELVSKGFMSRNLIFEYKVRDNYDRIVGSVDCFDRNRNIFWEFKITSTVQTSHVLQTVIYIALHYHSTGQICKGYLYNITHDICIIIECKQKELDLLLEFLFSAWKRKKNIDGEKEKVYDLALQIGQLIHNVYEKNLDLTDEDGSRPDQKTIRRLCRLFLEFQIENPQVEMTRQNISTWYRIKNQVEYPYFIDEAILAIYLHLLGPS